MGQPIVTISGQRVYPLGQSAEPEPASEGSAARDDSGRQVTLTEMSPSGWAAGGNEETFEAGLPFLAGLLALILFTVTALILLKRRH